MKTDLRLDVDFDWDLFDPSAFLGPVENTK